MQAPFGDVASILAERAAQLNDEVAQSFTFNQARLPLECDDSSSLSLLSKVGQATRELTDVIRLEGRQRKRE